jgi:hypothetical protein
MLAAIGPAADDSVGNETKSFDLLQSTRYSNDRTEERVLRPGLEVTG